MMKSDSPEITRVLVVDEVPETANVIELILRKSCQCEVSLTSHPSKAMPLIATGGVDLVLCEAFSGTDFSLNLCRKLKASEEFQHVPVILYSGIHDRQSMLKGFDAGAVDYLFKPLFPMELAARVKSHFQLKRQTDLTIQKVIEQQELIQIMCHDIPGPVGASLTLLELAQENPDLVPECLESVISALKKAMDLSDLVRQLQAIEDGKRDWTLEPLNLREAVADATSIFKERLERKDLRIDLTIDPEISVQVERISFINSVLANLLSNSIKFSPSGSVITCSTRTEGNNVVFVVSDPGIGMPQSIMDNLFKLGVPTNRVGTNNETGTGYGLPLVKKFVESYNGEIRVFSKHIDEHPSNHGTRIELTLGKS